MKAQKLKENYSYFALFRISRLYDSELNWKHEFIQVCKKFIITIFINFTNYTTKKDKLLFFNIENIFLNNIKLANCA